MAAVSHFLKLQEIQINPENQTEDKAGRKWMQATRLIQYMEI